MLRYGIAGFGRHAVKRLMPGFAGAKLCRVTALWRQDPAAAKASAATYNIPHAFSSVETLCRCAEVDVVFVASPDALHLEHTLLAFEHGKHVLCEKPMAMNTAECRRMLEAAVRAGKLLGVAHVFRFEESVRIARELVASGELGEISDARSEFHYPAVGHPRSWIADAALACGGPVADVGVHCIDVLRWVLGSEVQTVKMTGRKDEHSGTFEAAGTLTLGFANGVAGTVDVSAREAYRTPLTINGSKASFIANDGLTVDKPITLEVRYSDGRTRRFKDVSNEAAYAKQVDAFAEALIGGSPFLAPGLEGLRNQMVLDAAYRSWKTGQLEEVST
jgi:predicted dehydrogenase